MVLIWFTTIITIITSLLSHNSLERFCASRIQCPTRNMSYDLRGEAYYPPRDIDTWNQSTIGIYDPHICYTR